MVPHQNDCLRACFETLKLGCKPISILLGNHTSAFKNLCFSINVSQIYRKSFKMWYTSNGANVSLLKLQVRCNRNNVLHIYGFIYCDPPCFFHGKLMAWTGISQLLYMTIPFLSIQMQSFSVFTIETAQGIFMASPTHFLFIIHF